MPLRLIAEILNRSTQIFVTRTHSPLAAQLIFQLSHHPHLVVQNQAHSPQVVIHLAGFDPPSLSHAVSYTSELHKYLDLALSAHAKFILVLPSSPTPFHDVALSLVQQFVHSFSLDCHIIEVDPHANLISTATAIIQTFVHSFHPLSTLLPGQPSSSPPPPAPVSTSPRRPKLTFLWLLLIPLLPWFTFALEVLFITQLLSCTATALHTNSWNRAITCSTIAAKTARLAQIQLPFTPASRLVFSRLPYSPPVIMDIATRTSETLLLAQKLVPTDPEFIHTVSRLSESLAYLQSDINNVFTTTTHPPSYLLSLGEGIIAARGLIHKISLLAPDLPRLLSLNRKSVFLVLLQDSTELRPTGGFLDSLAFLTLENGRVSEIEIVDTAAADTQLRGHVEPPAALKTALSQDNWYLRDSNWDPHFPITAKRIAWFVQKELSRSPDVVIAANLTFYSQLLGLAGPVNLPQFGGQINSTNFIQKYLQFAAGGSASPRFLPSLTEALNPRLRSLTPLQSQQLAGVFIDALQNRQIFVYPISFTSSGLTASGWDGGVVLPTCRSQYPCLSQFLYPLDANVGINKVNPHISRQVFLNTTLASTRATSTYRALYTHTSSLSAWPSGHYKNYFRLYLPSSSQLDQVRLDNQVLSSARYTLTQERGQLVVALLLDLAPATTATLEIVYHQDLPASPRFHYQLDVLNQPGLLQSPLTVTLTYPPSWIVSSPLAPAVASPGRLGYNTPLSQAFKLDVDFAPTQ